MNYVTYDAAGNLTGAFLQDLQPEHAAAHIVVSDEILRNWVNYRANAACDGVELIPPTAPDVPTLDEAKAQCTRECDLLAKAKREAATADYAPAEMASWPIKLAEAQAYSTDSTVDTPRLTLEASERQIPLEDLVTKVLAKATILATLEARIAGINGRHNDVIKALTEVDDVLAYDITQGWPV